MLVDSHAHLQWPSFARDREVVISRAKEAGVAKVVSIGVDLKSSAEAVDIAAKHEGLYATVGFHPHNAKDFTSKSLEDLEKLCESPKVVAVGEVGLDFYRNLSPRSVQEMVFEAQLSLAEKLDLPVVIHDREAHESVLRVLSSRGKLRGVMHCFSGDQRMAEQCINMGFYVSLAGTVTFPGSHRLREVARSVDSEMLLVETDCPWLAPQNVRGRRNEPSFLPYIAECVADLRGIEMEELAEKTTENAEKLFAL